MKLRSSFSKNRGDTGWRVDSLALHPASNRVDEMKAAPTRKERRDGEAQSSAAQSSPSM
jgi:hypothetical protein